jgi:hypothetical protein
MGLDREGDMRAQIDDGHTRGNGVANTIVRVLLPLAVRRMRSGRRLVVHEGVIRVALWQWWLLSLGCYLRADGHQG